MGNSKGDKKGTNVYFKARVKEVIAKNWGTIKTKQFQGKEYHYSIEVSGQIIIAHARIREQYHVGEEVVLVPIVSEES